MKYLEYSILAAAVIFISCKSASPTANNNSVSYQNATFASGRVSMEVTISGMRQWQDGGDADQKTVEATATYAFDLPKVAVDNTSSTKAYNWDNPGYGGAANWFEEFKKTYLCNIGGTNTNVTDIDSSTKAFSGHHGGGGALNINSDGSYILTMSGQDGSDGTEKHSSTTNCPTHNETSGSGVSSVPFLQYWAPFFGGATGFFSGTILPANAGKVSGTFQGNDTYEIFSSGTTKITLPVSVKIIWDITLTN